MKKDERHAAQALRRQGFSVNEIVAKLGVAKSSVSIWVRDIPLSEEQLKRIASNGRSVESIERRRKIRLENEYAKRQVVYQEAVRNIAHVSKRELMLLGLGLYWGEGSKTSRGTVGFYNSDPQIIQVMVRFYVEVCDVAPKTIKGRVLLHPHLDKKAAERYWSSISGIPLTQFGKTTLQKSRASKDKRDTLPFGTFSITAYDTNLFLKVMGMTEGVYQRLVPKRRQVASKYLSYL